MVTPELRYIESNPKVCSGKWVIRGTRILVWVIQDQIARHMSAEEIMGQWHGKVSLASLEEIIDSGVRDPEPVDDPIGPGDEIIPWPQR